MSLERPFNDTVGNIRDSIEEILANLELSVKPALTDGMRLTKEERDCFQSMGEYLDDATVALNDAIAELPDSRKIKEVGSSTCWDCTVCIKTCNCHRCTHLRYK